MKCLSINLWNINEPFIARMDNLKKYISHNNPDIICMQEVSYVNGHLQIDFLHNDLGYNILYCKSGIWQGREEGLVIATKHKIIRNDCITLPMADAYNDMQRILMLACIEIEKHDIYIFNTHLSYHINSKANREKQAKIIGDYLNTHNFRNVIVCGDFNRFDNERKDFYSLVYNNVVHLQIVSYESSNAMYSFSKMNEFVSDNLWPNRNIDYIFVSPNGKFTSTLCMNETDGFLPCSDHYGILAKGDFIYES